MSCPAGALAAADRLPLNADFCAFPGRLACLDCLALGFFALVGAAAANESGIVAAGSKGCVRNKSSKNSLLPSKPSAAPATLITEQGLRVVDIQVERQAKRNQLADHDAVQRCPRLSLRDFQHRVLRWQWLGVQKEIHAIGVGLQPGPGLGRQCRQRPLRGTAQSKGAQLDITVQRRLSRAARPVSRFPGAARNPSGRNDPARANSPA